VSTFLQYLFSGLTLAGLYAPLAVGWSLGWSVFRALNLMVGEYVVVAALTYGYLDQTRHWSTVAAMVTAVGVTIATGLVTDLVLRVTKVAHADSILIVTLALSLMAHDAFASLFGRSPFLIAPVVSGSALEVSGAKLPWQVLLLLSVDIAIVAVLEVVLRATTAGRSMRATAENPLGATWCGIEVRAVRTLTIAITAGVCAVGGICAVPVLAMQFDSGTTLAVLGLIAAIIGGLGRIGGAAVGALVLGILQAMTSGYVSSTNVNAYLYVLLIVILLLTPNGVLAAFTQRYRRTRVSVVSAES
jgi:branched-chain amino acid transport system permease protein